MHPDIKTRPSQRVLWAPSQDPAPAEASTATDRRAPKRRPLSAPPPPLPLPSRAEVGFFGAFGPLFYFVALILIVVLGALLLLFAQPDSSFQPLSDGEWSALASTPPPPAVPLPRPTSLHLESEPGAALVYVDDIFQGITPYWTDDIASGQHVITLRKDGYASSDTLIYLEKGQAATLSLTLTSATEPTPEDPTVAEPEPAEAPLTAVDPIPGPATGTMQIDTAPAGAAVRIDGRRVGGSPLLLRDLTSGTHTVTLHLQGYAPQTLRVAITPGRRSTVRADLVPLTGTLSMIVRPWGSLYVDGVLHAADTDLRHEIVVPVGPHVVRAVHPVLGAQEWRVEVETDRTTPVDFDLH